jgi:hypothetical protein
VLTKSFFNKALVQAKNLPMRRIKLHEYQAGALLHKFKIPIPLGNVAYTPNEAHQVASTFKSSGYVVKA